MDATVFLAYTKNSFYPETTSQVRVTYQCWTWSGFRIAIQPDSALQNRIGLDFEKTHPDRIWISNLHWSLQ